MVESELQHAIERAEKAEKSLSEIPKVPPAPPLPPPPPLPTNLTPQPPIVPIRTKKLARNGVSEIAEALGINETATDDKKVPLGIHNDIINQIKGGTFTLKKSKNENKKKDRETPKAVTEMLNVLGSLRKVSRNKMTVSTNFGDVQL